MNINVFFTEHPVFCHDEFVGWKTRKKPLKPISIKTALQYYVKTGQIFQIKRGVYAVIPPNQTASTATIDPYLIAAKSAPDSILSHHTALELHGMAYSVFGQLTYLTQTKNKTFEFQNQLFQPTNQPTLLVKKNQTLTNTQTINRQGMEIKITTLERTFVDILDRIELSGGWEEICWALDNMLTINANEVIDYCLKLENSKLAAKVGYFLEQRTKAFKVKQDQLSRLLDAKPKNPQYASKRNYDKFELVKKWNLLLPSRVIHKTWEEPDVEI